MTNIHFTFPVQDMTGSVSEEKNISFRTRYGKTHVYHFRNPSKLPDSAARVAHRQAFADARRQAFAELQDPQKRTKWEAKFKKQKRYVRLDCFVAVELLKATKQ